MLENARCLHRVTGSWAGGSGWSQGRHAMVGGVVVGMERVEETAESALEE